MEQLKDEIIKFFDLLKQYFPEKKGTVSLAKIQLVPLLLLVPETVATGVVEAFQPYIKFIKKDQIDEMLKKDPPPPLDLPGLPVINLVELIQALNGDKRNELAGRILSLYDRAQLALSRKKRARESNDDDVDSNKKRKE